MQYNRTRAYFKVWSSKRRKKFKNANSLYIVIIYIILKNILKIFIHIANTHVKTGSKRNK